ncbi:MAG: transglycosylase domain-containing protein, partial [Oleiphilaceae bacterium]|nr:transglycosylase domain-containing protein [Oleiphilaceae bacterium]
MSSSQHAHPWYRHALLWKVIGVLSVLAVAWLIYLDAQVRYKFEGKRWALPAQVYARALELYEGRALNAALLYKELALLNYRSVSHLTGPGQYRTQGERIDIWRRAHSLPEGQQQDLRLSLSVRDDVIVGLESQDQPGIGLTTIEPLRIGGIYPASQEEREVLRYDAMPQLLIAALLATEDRDFFDHWGVSPMAIARAMWVNVRAGRVVQGGSTLTQQLVKNFYLSRERSLWRKANEAAMALMLEAHYSKEDILETYLNDIFLGQAGNTAVHGFGMASRFYFGKPLNECDLHELALMVAIIKGPSYYNPRRYPERALERRNLVLKLMMENGYIAEGAYEAWSAMPLGVVAKPRFQQDRYPAFMELVKRQLRDEYDDEDLRSEGLKIYTTLDPQVQESLERAASAVLASRQDEALQIGAVVSGVGTGEVAAVLGDRDPRYQGFNRALDASRPVGSLIKPAIFLTALSQPENYHLMTALENEPFRLEFSNGDTWTPNNFDGETGGQV